MLSLMI